MLKGLLYKEGLILQIMKKLVILGALVIMYSGVKSQTIQYSKSSISGIIKSDGSICGSTGVAAGYVKNDGTIENANHVAIGYLLSDGTIQDANHTVAGYIKSDGTVQDSQQNTIGYIKDDGTIQDAANTPIAHVPGIQKNWIAIAFFFFKMS
jgi:hypothetical protein